MDLVLVSNVEYLELHWGFESCLLLSAYEIELRVSQGEGALDSLSCVAPVDAQVLFWAEQNGYVIAYFS